MARQPFFSGNYGSALGQIDTRPIMQGAAAQAAMYQGLGQNIGGAIEKYGLNKVKRAKMTGEIEAYIKENPDYINESTMTGDEAADKKNMTQFEKFAAGDLNMAGLEGLAGKLARGDTLRKNRLLEESQRTSNEAGRFNLDLAKKLEESKISVAKSEGALAALKAIGFTKEQKTVLENLEARTLSVIAGASKTIAETAGLPAEQATALEIKRKELEVLKQKLLEMPKDAKNRDALAKVNLALKNLELGAEPGRLRAEAAQRVIDQEKGLQDIEKGAAVIARDASAEEAYSSAEQAEDAKKKAAATAKETEARTGILIAELGALLEANKPIDESMLVGVENAILPIDIEIAAGGDAAGWLTDAANWVAGIAPVAGGTGISPDRIRERTNLANLQGMVVPAFLRGISTHGGKWAREDIMRMIPQEDDSNAEMRSKIKRLIPHMRKKLVEAHHIYSKGTSNASARNTALQIKTQFPGVIKMLVQSVGGGDNVAKAEQFLREGQ